MWDPAQYAAFTDHRSRAFHDLLARVGAAGPALVVDLGCGSGELTLELARRWPTARVVGVDSSPEMVRRAREMDNGARVEWVEQSAEAWQPPTGIDVLVSNAALQWVPRHRELIPGWVERLSPDGWFAMQVPGNFDAPSHSLLRGLAGSPRWSQRLGGVLRHTDVVGEPADYLRLLGGLGLAVDAWETTYQQVLDPSGQQPSPVLEWTKGTALRPVLDVLGEGPERETFFAQYAALLDQAYPRTAFGVPFAFRRIFAVAHRV